MWPMTTVASDRGTSASRKKMRSDRPVMIGGIRKGRKTRSCSTARKRDRLARYQKARSVPRTSDRLTATAPTRKELSTASMMLRSWTSEA